MCQKGEEVLRNSGPGDHAAYLYSDVSSLLDAVALYGRSAIERGEAFVLVATEPNIVGVKARLDQVGHDCESLAASGQLTALGAEKTLAEIMASGVPSLAVFEGVVRPIIAAAQEKFGGPAVYGELVNLLWNQGDRPAAHILEQWWNELIAECGISLLCGYGVDAFDFHEDVQNGIDTICSTHSHLIPVTDDDRLDHAVDAAMQHVFHNGDSAALRKHLLERNARLTKMPPAHAALLGLHDILPSLAQDVRMLAREYYRANAAN